MQQQTRLQDHEDEAEGAGLVVDGPCSTGYVAVGHTEAGSEQLSSILNLVSRDQCRDLTCCGI